MIADKRQQEVRWLAADRNAWEGPSELINCFWDDGVFELFLEQYARTFSEEQCQSAFDLRDTLNAFCGATPDVLDPMETLRDPRWQVVRQKAAAFIDAFAGKWPDAR
ncbi:MAG TPA: hypothetical protein VKT75_13765 [Acidobacteriaceae bacterium]|nr:hypothetical protein [Acidobacteriaceae bacterium]